MAYLQTLSLILVLIGSTLPTKVTSVKKDASEIKVTDKVQPEGVTETSRISRQSSLLYTPASNIKYQYQYFPLSVLAHGGDTLEQTALSGNDAQYITQQLQEYYQNLPQKEQNQILAAFQAAEQPIAPVYHATPLQTYGALLKQTLGDSLEDKSVLVTPKPIEERQEGDQPGEEKKVGSQSYYTISNNAVGKHTEVVIPEPKYAPLVYKSLYQQQQSLHQSDEQEEPKNYAAKYQFGYQVRDPKHGTFFGHVEARDGHHTKGHYHVLLPDGRLQNVQYWADLSGYHAQVSYNAAAKHPVASH